MMTWSTTGVKSSLTALLLLAVLGVVRSETILNAKPEIGSKKVLVILPVAAASHNNVFSAVTDKLLERGHHITMVTALPGKKHPRKREIIIEDPFKDTFENATRTFFTKPQNPFHKIISMYFLGPALHEAIFSEPKVMDLKKENFDLVITEAFFFQEAMLAFGHHFGCPSMAINPSGYSLPLNQNTGGATNPSYVVHYLTSTVSVKALQDRVMNTLTAVFFMLTYNLFYYPKINALMHEAFPNAPPLYDLISNLSLTLINNNDALMFPVPLAPSVIQVGGMHIKPGKPLSGDLKKWVEESKEGIVYFSLGSNLKTELIPIEMQNMIISSFGKLKQRVLVKWSGPLPENAPTNCRFEEWVPQQEILAHPKLLVFVTHGGLLSIQESVYYGAAVIALPVFGDQQMNAALAEEKGFAVTLSIFDFTSETFDAALAEIISNPKYREQSRKLKELFRSDPVPPQEKAVYYTELLMKLGTLKHLQPASIHLSWYQYLLLDVAAVLLVCVWVTWRVIRFVFGKCIACCRRQKAKKD